MATRSFRFVAALGLICTAALAATVAGCASDNADDHPNALKGDTANPTYAQRVEQNRDHARGAYTPRLPGNGGQ